MKDESYTLFANAKMEEILETLEVELLKRNESPFWSDKVVPFAGAILTVLVPLRDANMLFNPQGRAADMLTPELFLSGVIS